MPDQIVLAWEVDVANSVLGPTEAALALAAVPLYQDPVTDPILGQLFGLTVESDVSAQSGATTAARTLTLNMTGAVGAPTAPPPFPCGPRTSTPPELPYPLRRAVTLPGSFSVTNGLAVVNTTDSQAPNLAVGDVIQLLSQQGVFYEVMTITLTTIVLTAPYTGVTGTTTAAKEVAAPVTLAAFFSTSELDTNGVATTPAIAPGSGAREVELTYLDSTGAGPFTVAVELTGKRPAAVVLDGASIDIAVIVNIAITSVGDYENSVGEITLVELSRALPPIPPDTPIGTGIGPAELIARTFKRLTDEAQLLIARPLAYLPPSYFAVSAPGSSQTDPAAPPTDDELSGPLGQFVAPAVAMPPPNPPFPPSTVPAPTFLSGLFTRTLELALAGVPVVAQPIMFV